MVIRVTYTLVMVIMGKKPCNFVEPLFSCHMHTQRERRERAITHHTHVHGTWISSSVYWRSSANTCSTCCSEQFSSIRWTTRHPNG